MSTLKLIEIGPAGDLPPDIKQDDILRSVVEATVALYQKVGFMPPWIGYIARKGEVTVGTCGFKSPPVGGQAEIAYFTFPGHEGQGIATWMAEELVRIAKLADGGLKVTAQTLPENNASTAVLTKVGFQFARTVDHPEDGLVWEWELMSPSGSC